MSRAGDLGGGDPGGRRKSLAGKLPAGGWRCYMFLLVFVACTGKDPEPPPVQPGTGTFSNPLLMGSDPWVWQEDTTYYYTQTSGNRVSVWKTGKMSQLSQAPVTTIFTPVPGTANAENIWAPEIHRINGRWYVYFSAGSGPDSTQRIWVLENSANDPTSDNWVSKGRMQIPGPDNWAIDATVMQHNGEAYLLWSGRPDSRLQRQNIYIAAMQDPWTVRDPVVMISTPDQNWEQRGGPVNEAPQVLRNATGQVMVVYSASGCWTDDYALGMLTLIPGADPLQASDWTKTTRPVFQTSAVNKAFGPGHNAFFKSRNGTENWIIYHANSNAGEGCGERRNIRMQSFIFNAQGQPVFGEPVTPGARLKLPAGE